MIALILSTAFAAAWTPLPHIDGSSRIQSLSALGDTLLACGAGGCASTTDRGASWISHSQTSLPDIHATVSGSFGLTELEGRVHRSLDGGRQWSPWNEGIPDSQGVSTFHIHGDLAYAATWKVRRNEGASFYSEPCGAYVRTREAASWTAVASSSITECDEIAFGPGGDLLRVTRGSYLEGQSSISHLERSHDQGRSWDSALAGHYGLEDLGNGMLTLHLESSDSSLLSLDTGRTWTVRLGFVGSSASLDGAVRPDGQDAWIDPRSGAARPFDLDSIGRVRQWTRTGNVLWVRGARGLFSSLDSGRTWARADRTFPLEYAPSLVTSAGRLYRSGIQGDMSNFTSSVDGGRTWAAISGTYTLVAAPEACDDEVLAPTRTGTLVVRANQARHELGAFTPEFIDCAGRSRIGFDGNRLAAWSDTGWLPSAKTVRGVSYAMEIAATDAGVFFAVDDPLTDRIGVSFLPAESDSALRGPSLPYAKAIQGSPRGAWVSTTKGLFLCTDAATCTRAPLPGIDSNWSFLGAEVQGPFVFASALPMGLTYDLDFSRPRLFASADSGRTWSSFDLPALVRSFQATSQGILASSYGRGLWLLDDPIFHTTSVGPRPGPRSNAPLVRLRGRTLLASGLEGPSSMRLSDASGRILLDRELQVRDGSASLSLGQAPRGLLLVQVTSSGRTTTQGIVVP